VRLKVSFAALNLCNIHSSGYVACFNYSVFTRKLESAKGGTLWVCTMGMRRTHVSPAGGDLAGGQNSKRCMWPSCYHCHSPSLASVKSRLVLRFWYRLTWVIPDKIQRAVKWLCVYVCVCVHACVCRVRACVCCKVHMDCDLNFIVKAEGPFKVPGSHLHWKSGNILQTVLDGDVITGRKGNQSVIPAPIISSLNEF